MFINNIQGMELLPRWTNVVFATLVTFGIHLGHSVLTTLKFCAWMIKGQRKGIFLIDLFKFAYMFRAGFFALEVAIRGRNPVWFVNLDKTSFLFVKFPALECGEFWVVENWIRGMISNYYTIKKSLAKTTNKPFPAWNNKTFLKSSSFSHWGLTRHSWPRLIFVSNVMRSYGPCHEAHRLKIPSLGIVDTNTAHSLVAIAIPGNDEAATAIVFYNSLVSTFILYIKYSFIHNWYIGCLNENKFSFGKWWGVFPKKNDLTLRPNVLNFHFDQLRYMIGGFEAQFLQDLWQTRSVEALHLLGKARVYLSAGFIKNFYKSRALFFKSLKATWTITSFGLAFLRPRLRRWFSRNNILRRSKHSPLQKRNLEMLLRLPRWKRKFFFRVARRLRRSRQPRKSYQFFYKFFGLGCLFSFFRSNFFFSRRFFKAVNFKRWWMAGHVRFPWANHTAKNRLSAPRSYRRVYMRPKMSWATINWRNNGSQRRPFSLSTSGFGLNKRVHQFPKEWSKQLWLARHINSLGIQLSRIISPALRLNARRFQHNFYSYIALPLGLANSSFTGGLARAKVSPFSNRGFVPLKFFFKHAYFAQVSRSSFLGLKKSNHKAKRFSWADQRIKYLLSLDHFDFFSPSNLNFHIINKVSKQSAVAFSRLSPKKIKSYFIFKYA